MEIIIIILGVRLQRARLFPVLANLRNYADLVGTIV